MPSTPNPHPLQRGCGASLLRNHFSRDALHPPATHWIVSRSIARQGMVVRHRTSLAAHGRDIRHPLPEHSTLLTTSNSLAKPQGDEVNHQERLRYGKSPLIAGHSDHPLACRGEPNTEVRAHPGKNACANSLHRERKGTAIERHFIA
ncbi:MAG: hypothetical protein RIS70_2065 [Planctomycetota bacterium]